MISPATYSFEGATTPAEACYCCGETRKSVDYLPEVAIARCHSCGTLRTAFSESAPRQDPWQMGSVTPAFLDALQRRRNLQAAQIAAFFGAELQRGPLIDYGCGQGSFVHLLRERRIDAFGCDISDSHLRNEVRDKFIRLAGPRALPDLNDFRTISFLDVLEHVEDPGAFVAGLQDSNVTNVLVKVPMLKGPIGAGASILARMGRSELLQRLLLVGEISPHYSFFTSRGLEDLFKRHGFTLKSSLRIADVGTELPERMRGKDGEPPVARTRLIGTCLGAILASIAPAWSDTRVFLFSRAPLLTR